MNYLVNLAIGAAVAAMIAVVGLVAINTMNQRTESRARMPYASVSSDFGPEPMLANPLSGLEQWEVLCSSADAGVTTKSLMTDTGGTVHSADSFVVGNDSTTCVRIGGSTVTSSTGESIGTDCRSGKELSIDAKGGYCKSAGAAVTVDVTAGRR